MPCIHCGDSDSTRIGLGNEDVVELCPVCYVRKYARCSICSNLYLTSELETNQYNHNDILICPECGICRLCGRFIHRDSMNSTHICNECYNRNIIRSYNFRPRIFHFYQENEDNIPIYLGVEVEIDHGGYSYENAKTLLDIMGGDKYAYVTHDGSLNNGFEIVGHPMTLSYIKKKSKWKDVFNKAITMGYVAHNTNTCGLHVHVNRTAFGKYVWNQDKHIAILIYLYEKFWSEMVWFSRRTQHQLERFAQRYMYGHENIKDICPESALKRARSVDSKYFAVNIINENTVELRIFKGTLNYHTFLATLEMCDGIVRMVSNMSLQDAQELTWDRFRKILTDNYEYIGEYFDYLDSRAVTRVNFVKYSNTMQAITFNPGPFLG